MLQDWRPDVILLDVVLAGTSARSFRTEVEADDTLRDVPVIAMSGIANLRIAAGALRAAAMLTKPFDLDHLLRILANLVGSVWPTPCRISE